MRAALCLSPSRYCGRCFLLALVMPWLLGLADCGDWRAAEAVSRPGLGDFRAGRDGAVVGLALGGARAGAALLENAQITPAPVTRMALEPYPVNPFRWHAILETASFYQTAEVNTLDRRDRQRSGARRASTSQPTRPPWKPPSDAAGPGVSGLGHVGRGARRGPGSRWPALDPPKLPPGRTWTTVEFSDLRFDYSFLALVARCAAIAAGRLGLYRGQSRRCRRRDGRTGAKIAANSEILLQMERFVGLVERFRLTMCAVDRRMKEVESSLFERLCPMAGVRIPPIENEVCMIAYLLLLVAVLTRVMPHAGWMNFTAVGGALLYFGARRSWREMLAPLAVLMATDYYLTVYHLPLRVPLAGLPDHMDLVLGGDGAGTDFAESQSASFSACWPARCWDRRPSSWFRILRCGPAAHGIRARWPGLARATWRGFPSTATMLPRPLVLTAREREIT